MSPAVIAVTRVTSDEMVMSGRARAMASTTRPGTTQMIGTVMYPSTRVVRALRARSRRARVAARAALMLVEDAE